MSLLKTKLVKDLKLEEHVVVGLNGEIGPGIAVEDHLDPNSVNAVENRTLYYEFYNLGISGGDFVSVDLDQNSALDVTGGSYIADAANIYCVKADSKIVFDNTSDEAYYRLRVVQFHNAETLSNLYRWNGALKPELLDISYYNGDFQYYDAEQDTFLTKKIVDIIDDQATSQWHEIREWINNILAYKNAGHSNFINFEDATEFKRYIEENGFPCLSSNDTSGHDTLSGLNNILTLYRIPHDTPVDTKLKDIKFEYVGHSNPSYVVLNTLSPFNKTMDFDFTDQNVILDQKYDYVYVLRTSWDDSLKTLPLFSEESMKSIRWSRYLMYKLDPDIIEAREHTNLWLGQETFNHPFNSLFELTLDELKDVDAKTGESNTNAKYIIGANFNVKVEQYTVKFKTVATKEYVDNRIESLTTDTDDEYAKLESNLSNIVEFNQVAKTADYLVGTDIDGYSFNRINGFYGFTAVLSSLSSNTDIPYVVTDVKIANSSTDRDQMHQTADLYCNIWKYDGTGEKTDFSNWKYIASSTNSQKNSIRYKGASLYMDFIFDSIALDPSKLYLFQLVDQPNKNGNSLSARVELLQRSSTPSKEYTHDDVNFLVGTIPDAVHNTLNFNSNATLFPLVEFDGLSPAEGFALAAAMIHGGTSGGSSGPVEIDIDSELNGTSENPVENKAIFSKFQQISTDLSVDIALNETSTHAIQNKAIYRKISEIEEAIAEIDPSVIPPHYDEFKVPVFSGKQYTEMLTSNVLDWSLSASTMDTIDIDMTHTLYPMLSVVFNNIADGGNAGNTHTTADVVEVDYTESYLSSAKFRIPTVIQTNSGRLIASYDIRWNSHNDIAKTPYTDQCTGFSYSDDGGKTWSKKPSFLMGWYYEDENGYVQSGVSDPSLLYDDENDVIFCFAIAGNGTQSQTIVNQAQIKDARRTQLVMSYSTDNGETWSKAEIVTDKIFDSDGVSQSWICTSDNTSGLFGFIFGCCSNGIRLTHQQNNADNGLVLAVQLWPTNGLYGLSSTRCTFAHFYPTYQKDKFGNKKATVKFVLTESFIGDICKGAHEGQLAEDEHGKIAYICKSMSTFSGVCFRIFTTTDCGRTWTVVGNTDVLDTDNQPTGDKIFSEIANTPSDRVKPSIAYSEYMHRWFISYSNHTNRGCPAIRYADSIPDNPTEAIWKTFDVCDFSTQSAGYTNLISIDKSTSLGIIYESHLDSCPNSAHNSKSFGYNSYSFLPKKQTQFSSTWREFARYTNEGSSANDTCKALSFKLSDFTDDKFAMMKTFTYRGQNSSAAMPSGYQNISTRIALYESDNAQPNSITASTNATLVTQLDHKAISKPLNWSIDGTADTCYNGRKYEFVFEHPVTLKQGKTYFLAQYADDVEYPTLADYFEAFTNSDGNTQPTYFYVTLLKIAPSNGSRVGVIGYNASFKEISYTRDGVSRRYSPLCWISSK